MTGLVSRRTVLTAIAAGALIPLAGCASLRVAPSIALASGEPGGVYLKFAELLHDALHARGTASLEVVPTNGSVENLTLLAEGRVSVALALLDAAETHAEQFVAIGRVYQNYLQCVVPFAGPVQAWSDLAGKPISIGATGSGSSFTTRRLLEATNSRLDGLPPIVHERTLTEAADALRNGEIDALFWSGGIPTPTIAELSATFPLRLIDLTDARQALSRTHPDTYLATGIPRGVYGATASVGTVGIPNLLLARPDLPDSVASALVDVLIGDATRLIPHGTVGLQFLTPASLIDTGHIPLHPAAKRRFRQVYA